MKIANIILTSQQGGAEQCMIDYSVALKNLGHEVINIVRHDAPYTQKLTNLGFNVKTIRNKFGYIDIFAILQIQKILSDQDCDIVFSHSSKASALTRLAIENKEIYQAAVNHSNNIKRSMDCDYMILVNSQIMKKAISNGRNQSNCKVIPNAIDLSDKIKTKAGNLELKSNVTIGTLSRIDKHKGIEHLIEALSLLKDSCFNLRIAGSGGYTKSLKELTKKLNLQDKVEFIGWIDNKKEFFESIDLFCLPSMNETFGIVILEAMKHKTPVIVTACDGPKDIINHDHQGILIDLDPASQIPEKIALEIKRITNNKELYNKITEEAYQKVKSCFSLKSLEKNLEEVIIHLTQNKIASK